MKEKIEKKFEEFADSIMQKENPTLEEVNFLVYLLNRIEIKENQQKLDEEKRKSDLDNKEWRAKMFGMLGEGFNNG